MRTRLIKALDILFWIVLAVFILVLIEATWGPFLK